MPDVGAPSSRRSDGLLRAVAIVTVAALLLAFALIQVASDALDARAAAPGALPRRASLAFGLRVYRLLDRTMPAPYVEAALARYALRRNRLNDARRHALRLPASPTRDELLAQIARARGEAVLAREYYLAAPDASAVDRTATRLGKRDPLAALALEGALEARLVGLATHPDAVAQASWRIGEFANQLADGTRDPSMRQAWRRRALRDYVVAVTLAPLDGKYLLAEANQALLVGERARARQAFAQALNADPASADALAGLGVVALRDGDRARAAADLAAARRLDPHSGMVGALASELARTAP